MNKVFAPGCALLIHNPQQAEKMHALLQSMFSDIRQHTICCRHDPQLPAGTEIINTCAGCDRRYRELYERISTVSFWELLDASDSFVFQDYEKRKMSILDACPTRNQPRVHKAIRSLIEKMNIELVEPKQTGTNGICCGDSFYGELPVDKVKEQMHKRAAEMPAEDVVVYCVSCIKAMQIGGRNPRYLPDLLFNEQTRPGDTDPDRWHAELDAFIEAH